MIKVQRKSPCLENRNLKLNAFLTRFQILHPYKTRSKVILCILTFTFKINTTEVWPSYGMISAVCLCVVVDSGSDVNIDSLLTVTKGF
jgi:hypothetical protein